MKILSVVIPCFNEKNTIREILDAVQICEISDIQKEIIIVDDCSTDGTQEILKTLSGHAGLTTIFQEKNQGKGAALRKGFKAATGDFIIIQDADLEYHPHDFSCMIQPLLEGEADVVYGSRFLGAAAHRVLFYWHYIGNRLLTNLSNAFTNLNLSDMETGYKAFTKSALMKILPHLESNRFGIEPEITAVAAKCKLRIYEVGISYHGRTYDQGKKINWKDGVAALWFIFKYNVLR